MVFLPLLLDSMDPFEMFDECVPSTSFGMRLHPKDLKRLQLSTNKVKRISNRHLWNLDKKGRNTRSDEDEFQLSLDVEDFKPEEISVKTVDNSIEIEGTHEEREDGQGFISRHFRRRYQLPDDFDINKVSSALSSDGILTVKAPKITQAIKGKEREVQIQHTGAKDKNIHKEVRNMEDKD